MMHVTELPGIAGIRLRFFARLSEKIVLVEGARTALESAVDADTYDHLKAAEAVLHSVAGAAGTLGLAEIGASARDCEEAIIALLVRGEGSIVGLHQGLGDFLDIARRSLD